MHKDTYMGLRMGDVGTKNFYKNKIELGCPNPSNGKVTYGEGLNIHKAGLNNYTGITKKMRNRYQPDVF